MQFVCTNAASPLILVHLDHLDWLATSHHCEVLKAIWKQEKNNEIAASGTYPSIKKSLYCGTIPDAV
jgi:hypothetical protein